jgi:hypothetical protein
MLDQFNPANECATDDADITATFVVVLSWAVALYVAVAFAVHALDAVFGWMGVHL